MSSYCDIAPGHPIHGPYHDREYGFPVTDDAILFERLALEIFQAGLSWLIVLKKRPSIFQAFQGFDPKIVAEYGPSDVDRLMADSGIIRNRRKIDAIIENARRILILQSQHGSFAQWLRINNPKGKEEWIKLFKKTFVFMGGEVVGEFLMSIGYLPGAHREGCSVYRELEAMRALETEMARSAP